jgi:hypothetical protein
LSPNMRLTGTVSVSIVIATPASNLFIGISLRLITSQAIKLEAYKGDATL